MKEKKSRARASFLLLGLLALGLGGAGLFLWDAFFWGRVDPLLLAREALRAAGEARSYRYQLRAEFAVRGGKRLYSRVEGEKTGNDYHIKGVILGTPVEVYQIGRRTYTKDPVSGSWAVLEGNDLERQQLLWAEINPLENFRFRTLGQPLLRRREKLAGRRCWVVGFAPQGGSKYLEMWWHDFRCSFWIDKKRRTLLRARLSARNRNSPGTFLTLEVSFRDYNRRLSFVPPV